MHGKKKTFDILAFAVQAARRLGFEADVMWQAYRESTMRSAWGEVIQTPVADAGVLTISLRSGLRAASVISAQLSRKSIDEAVKRCARILPQVPENPYLPELLTQPADLPEERIGIQEISEFLDDLSVKERAFRLIKRSSYGTNLKGSGRFFSAGCELGIANTSGLARYHTGSYSFLSLVVTGEKGLSSYADRVAATPDAVDAQGAIEEAFTRATLMESLPFHDPFADRQGPLHYDAVFAHYAVGEWMWWVSTMSFDGLAVFEGQSFLSGKQVGERITGENFTLIDDWQSPVVIPLPFGFEGGTRDRLAIIDQGIFRSVPYDGMTAKKARTHSTGHAPPVPLCIVVGGGDESLGALVERSGEPTIVATYFNYPSMPDSREGVFTATTRHGTFLVEGGSYRAVCPPLRVRMRSFDVLSRIDGMTSPRLIRGQENYGMFYPISLVVPAMRLWDVEFVGSNPSLS